MPDLTFQCADCGQQFVFTEGEQVFYQSKSLPQPIYCLICRGKHKVAQKDQFRGHSKFGK